MEWTGFIYERTENIQILHRPEGYPLIEASAVANIVNFQSLVGFVNLRDFNNIQFCIPFSCIDFLTGVYAEYSLQNRFGFNLFLFGLSAILKKHAHYLRLAAAAAWSREKQMSVVALGKEFDMVFEKNIQRSWGALEIEKSRKITILAASRCRKWPKLKLCIFFSLVQVNAMISINLLWIVNSACSVL